MEGEIASQKAKFRLLFRRKMEGGFVIPSVSSGIRKRKKRNSKKKHFTTKFLPKLVHYLKSDSHMFAPLLSSSSSPDHDPSSSSSELPLIPTSHPVVEDKLLTKIVDYLKSDFYMYSPLLFDHQGHDQFTKTSVMEKTRTEAEYRETGQKTLENRNMDGPPHTRSTKETRTEAEYRETGQKIQEKRKMDGPLHTRFTVVKHRVHQTCRSLTAQGL